jgi:hypothetical protein
MSRCPDCGQTDPMAFYKDASKGLSTYCIECNKIRRKNRPQGKRGGSGWRIQKEKATPPWVSRNELDAIDKMYEQAERNSFNNSTKYVVDHIIPLRSKIVCGLHCLANLQIISETENASKADKW